ARTWDAIIVGTGMGGATLGSALARRGLRVLFLEKGRAPRPDEPALAGAFAEQSLPSAGGPQERDTLARAGRWTDALDDISTDRPRRFVPFLGSGPGGSTALYGMALERFVPDDFTPRDPSALMPRWPVSYDELSPCYAAAERLFRLRGTTDPLC